MSGYGMMLGSNTHVSNMALRGATGVSGASAWTPADITTALWLDANDAATITEATGVSQWDDKSGNSRDVAQGTGADQPNYNSTNKRIEFDGAGDRLFLSSFDAPLSQPNSIFTVAKWDVTSDVDQIYDGFGTSRNALYTQSGASNWQMYAGSVGISGINHSTNLELSAAIFNTTASELYINGSVGSTMSVGTQDLDGIQIGGFTTGNFDGYINEIVIVNSAVDTATRQKIEGYLAWKWDTINGDNALRMALPSDHPYRYDGSLFGYVDAWNPSDITTALWLDASASDTITEATGVSQWDDLSGNDRHVTQGTGSAQPSYADSTVTFDGTDDYLETASTYDWSAGLTIVAAFNQSTTSSNNRPFGIRDTGASNKKTFGFDSDNSLRYDGANSAGGVAAATGGHIRVATKDATGDVQNDWIDGSVNISDTADLNTSTAQYINVGNVSALLSGEFTGDVYECIILDGVTDTATRQKIEGYLAWKWDGINGDTVLVDALPAGHPYKSSAPTI